MNEYDVSQLVLRDMEVRSSGHGAFTFIIKARDISEVPIQDIYGRENLGLKVFKIPFTSLDNYIWGNRNGHPLLLDTVIVQNIFAFEGVAPRIYDLILLRLKDNIHIAQVTDYLDGDFMHPNDAHEFWSYARELQTRNHLMRFSDWNEENLINGKWVDFQCFTFRNKKAYFEELINRLNIYNPCSRNNQPYVDIVELGVKGMRNWDHRTKAFKFDELDFKGKSVMDWGANTGAFCREAYRRGAKRVVGVEGNKSVVALQRELSNYLGYYNIDFHVINLRTKPKNSNPDVFGDIKRNSGFEKFDIHFFFSMDQHVGFPSGIGQHCNELMIVEGGVAQQIEYFKQLMEPEFTRVEFAGYSTDHARRVIMRGWNEHSPVS